MLSSVSVARRRASVPVKIGLGIGLTVIADWLFFGFDKGISVVIFFLAAMACAIIANPIHTSARQFYGACLIFALSLLPIIEGLTIVSGFLAIAGSLFFLLVISGALPRARHVLWRILLMAWMTGAFSALRQSSIYFVKKFRGSDHRVSNHGIIGFFIVIASASLFILLILMGNPLIRLFISDLDLTISSNWSATRFIWWLGYLWCAFFITHFSIRHYRRHWRVTQQGAVELPAQNTLARRIFSESGLVKALIIFNLIFAVQTVLDILYLWGRAELPNGMTYAAYAHQGAYPLFMTTMIAAVFIFSVVKKGGVAEASYSIRCLIYLWLAQNIALVLSAMLRLDLYVEAYALTMWRVAVFIWMGLVIVGFLLIGVRLALRRSNQWLIAMNAFVTIGVLYISCFVNFPEIVVRYNVDQALSQPDCLRSFDFSYASSLGMRAYPQIDRFLMQVSKHQAAYRHEKQEMNRTTHNTSGDKTVQCIYLLDSFDTIYRERRNERVASYLAKKRNWRSWSYRDKRALDYLVQNTRL